MNFTYKPTGGGITDVDGLDDRNRNPNPPLFIMENMKNRARISTFSKHFETSNKYKNYKNLVYRYRIRVPVDRII